MLTKPIKELETRVFRTYRGGALLAEFMGRGETDGFQPEDWISSFVEAKNKTVIKNEGLTLVDWNGEKRLLPDLVKASDFGEGREDAGVLVKLLDAAERLGIQVHPTKEYARRIFNSEYGKTECWHILKTRSVNGEKPCIYIGFKDGITRDGWRELFEKQDIAGMLNVMHKIEVKPGDTILVTGGTPHAIGAGCFMLEIQEPSDYTMRVERVTVAGEELTPMQIHYGVGEDNMLDCFEYIGESEEELRERVFLKPRVSVESDFLTHLVSYDDTPCFKLDAVHHGVYRHKSDSFTTLIVTENGGEMTYGDDKIMLQRGEKYFIPAGMEVLLENAVGLISYPPKI